MCVATVNIIPYVEVGLLGLSYVRMKTLLVFYERKNGCEIGIVPYVPMLFTPPKGFLAWKRKIEMS